MNFFIIKLQIGLLFILGNLILLKLDNIMKALLLNGILKDDPDFNMICSSIVELVERNGFEVEQI